MSSELLELAAGDKNRGTRDVKSLEYVEYIVPSMWFLAGCAFFALVFYGNEVWARMGMLSRRLQTLGQPSALADVALSFLAVTATLSLIYVLAHLLNGIAAAIIDRIIVRQLLQLPFQIYEYNYQSAHHASPASIRQFMRERASYAALCVSLVPIILCELTLTMWLQRSVAAVSLREHSATVFALSLLVCCVHFGVPRFSAPQRPDHELPFRYRRLALFHLTMLCGVAGLLTARVVAGRGAVGIIALLPLINILFILADRWRRRRHRSDGTTAPRRSWLSYWKATFVNWVGFAATLVDYGRSPSDETLRRAKEIIGASDDPVESFWLAHLYLERRAPDLYVHVSRSQALAAMNRNLSNATTCVLGVSTFTFWLSWPPATVLAPLVWVGTLAVLAYLFFIRFLYLLSEEQSRVLVLALASLNDSLASP